LACTSYIVASVIAIIVLTVISAIIIVITAPIQGIGSAMSISSADRPLSEINHSSIHHINSIPQL
jgi:hypothetical protein